VLQTNSGKTKHQRKHCLSNKNAGESCVSLLNTLSTTPKFTLPMVVNLVQCVKSNVHKTYYKANLRIVSVVKCTSSHPRRRRCRCSTCCHSLLWSSSRLLLRLLRTYQHQHQDETIVRSSTLSVSGQNLVQWQICILSYLICL